MNDDGLLRDLLLCAERIEQRLAQGAASSVEVKTSTRGADISVKAYAGSPLGELGDQALDEYVRLVKRAEAELMRDLEKTVKALK